MSHSASRNLHEMTNESMKQLDRVRSIMFFTIVVTLLLGVIVAIHLTRSITRPVSALVHTTRLISSGKFGSTTPYSDRTEFGELAGHFNTMSIAIRDGYEKIQKEVAERIQAEEALRESEARFRTFFEVSPIGILIYPMHAHPLLSSLKQTTFNTAFHNFFGYTREELEDMKISDISHPDDMQKNGEAASGFPAATRQTLSWQTSEGTDSAASSQNRMK